jgi:hypothetical protein
MKAKVLFMLSVDHEKATVEVVTTKAFKDCDVRWRADCLKSLMENVTAEYGKVLREMHEQASAAKI